MQSFPLNLTKWQRTVAYASLVSQTLYISQLQSFAVAHQIVEAISIVEQKTSGLQNYLDPQFWGERIWSGYQGMGNCDLTVHTCMKPHES